MSIDLTGTQLQNASIQYTYPDMNIKNMTKDTTTKISKFYFQTSINASTFTFIDSSSNSYISGTPTEGIISEGIHTGNAYELTIKHISPTGSDYFYVVFPLTTGNQWTVIEDINKKASSQPTNINIYADEYVGVSNKGLNDIIKSSFNGGSDIYKYTATGNKNVFVFKKPLKVNISNGPTEPHGLWSVPLEDTMNLITPDNNTQVLEEIECDYSGDKIEEPSIQNEVLNKRFARLGSITIFFAVFAFYTAFFYGIFKDSIPLPVRILVGLVAIALPIVGLSVKPIRKKINFLKINVYRPSSFYALFFIPLWDIVYKLMALIVYALINFKMPDDILAYLSSFINFYDNGNLENKRTYNMFLLGLMLIIWALFVCMILVK